MFSNNEFVVLPISDPEEQFKIIRGEAEFEAIKVVNQRGGLKPGNLVYHPPTNAVVHKLESISGDTAIVLVHPSLSGKYGEQLSFPVSELVDAEEVEKQFSRILDRNEHLYASLKSTN